MIRVLLGLIAGVILCGAVLFLLASGSSASAPGAMETAIARRARGWLIPRAARNAVSPVADSAEVFEAGLSHWADHCAGCHANDGSGNTTLGKRTWPPSPDMRLAPTQDLTDGELFYLIENGVRFTAMPGWGGGPGHDDADSWKLVRFIRRLPHLSHDDIERMRKLNPKSPDDLREEKEEEDFLKGK